MLDPPAASLADGHHLRQRARDDDETCLFDPICARRLMRRARDSYCCLARWQHYSFSSDMRRGYEQITRCRRRHVVAADACLKPNYLFRDRRNA